MTNSFFTGRRVLVTGASGFIGRNLCNELKRNGAEIYAVSTKERKNSDIICKWFHGDLTNYSFTESTLKCAKPSIIFHLAGFVTGQRDLDIVQPAYHNNLTSTVNMLVAATRIGIHRLILAGSMEEPETDSEELIPVSPYAASKWASTAYAKMFFKLYQTPVTIPRIFMVYGPGDKDFDNLIPYVIRCLIQGENPKLTSGTRLVDWIYIDDVVEGLIKMGITEGIEGKTVDLGTGVQFSVQEVCKKISGLLESKIKLDFGTLPDRPFEQVRRADLDKAEKYLGWKPQMGINKGLEQTITWFKNME